MRTICTRKEAITRIQGIIIVAVVVVAAVAGGIAWTFTTPPTPTTTSAAPKVEEVRIGILAPLTGAAAYFGDGMKAMSELLAKKINDEGGIKSLGGAKVRMIVADTEGKPDVGKTQTRRLITENKVHLIIGALHSGVTLPAAQESERYGIPFICDASSHVDLTRQGFRWFFRTWGSDAIFARNYFECMKWMQNKTGIKIKTIAFISEESLFGVGVATEWEKLNVDPEMGGYKLVAYIRHPVSPADLTSEAMTLKAANPDVVLSVQTPMPDAILWTKTLKAVDFFPKAFMTTAGFIFPEYVSSVGKDGEYIIGREGWSIDLTARKPIAKEINDLFKKEANRDMHVYTMQMHTTIVVARDALERAASVDPEKLRQALANTDIPGDKIIPPWKGVKFDNTGQNIYANNFMVQLYKGVYHAIWPEEIATIPLVYPAPTWKER